MKSILDEDAEERQKALRKIFWINQIGPLSILAGLAIAAAIHLWFVKR